MDQKVKWKEGRRSNVGRREVMMRPLRLVAPGGPADIHTYTHTHIYIYIYIEREREICVRSPSKGPL